MRRLVFPCVFMSILLSHGTLAAQPPDVEFWRAAHVAVDAKGKVTSLSFIDWTGKTQDDPVGLRLAPLIRSWVFKPGNDLAGQPTASETTLQMDLLESTAPDGNRTMKVVSALVGPGWAVLGPSPTYPKAEKDGGLEAAVNFEVKFDHRGVPISADNSSDYWGPGFTQQSEADFIEAARKVISYWRIEPEKIGGVPQPGGVRFLMVFCHEAPSAVCPLHYMVPMPYNKPFELWGRVSLVTKVQGTAF